MQVLNHWTLMVFVFTVKINEACVLYESSCNTHFHSTYLNQSLVHSGITASLFSRALKEKINKCPPVSSRAQTAVFFKAPADSECVGEHMNATCTGLYVCKYWRLSCPQTGSSVSSDGTRGSHVVSVHTDQHTHQTKSTLTTRRSAEMTGHTCSSFTGFCYTLPPPQQPSACCFQPVESVVAVKALTQQCCCSGSALCEHTGHV